MIEMYDEPMWEVYDPANAEVIAHFFHEGYAKAFVNYLNVAPPSPRG